jgi:hypothetical protein
MATLPKLRPMTVGPLVAVPPVQPRPSVNAVPLSGNVISFPQGNFVAEDSWAKRFGAWGALFVTLVVFGLYGGGLAISALKPDLPPSFGNLMETVKTLAVLCAGFWVGSSNSSQKKDDTISQGTAALAVSTPPTATVMVPRP